MFAGRDASRGLATFQVAAAEDDKFDDLSDLSAMEMDSVNEWEMQFKGKEFSSFSTFIDFAFFISNTLTFLFS